MARLPLPINVDTSLGRIREVPPPLVDRVKALYTSVRPFVANGVCSHCGETLQRNLLQLFPSPGKGPFPVYLLGCYYCKNWVGRFKPEGTKYVYLYSDALRVQLL